MFRINAPLRAFNRGAFILKFLKKGGVYSRGRLIEVIRYLSY